ncbi:protein-glutamate O-methyltransferase CheR [Myxococcaceae bacterium GXIMD 01537]
MARGSVLDDVTLRRVEDVLREACGVTLVNGVRRALDLALTRAAQARGMPVDGFLRRLLLRDPVAVETFIEFAVIGETYFFRHPEHLRELGRAAALRASPDPMLIWSAGCASGEEPYSIAMTLLAAGLGPDRFKVVATDVSGRALQRARDAVYGTWSVRRVEPDMERRFLSVRGDVVTVTPAARRSVEFRRHNLMTDPPPLNGLHAVFCRNVLIYFPQPLVREVLSKLVGALVPGGLLFVSPAEVPLAHALGLEPVEAPGGSVVMRVPVPGAARPAAPVHPLLTRPRPPAPLPAPPPPPRPAPVVPPPAALPAAVLKPPAPGIPEALERALGAARGGDYEQAEALAREAARELIPEAYLLLAMVAEGRGSITGAVDAVRKALYLEPQLAVGHAMLVALYDRMERREDSERARQNALRALDGLADEHPLRGVEAVTAGGLRQALAAGAQAGWQGAR